MILNITNHFRNNSNFTTDSEVDLFRKLAESICLYSGRSVFIEETHGPRKANVIFSFESKSTTRCEISDLLIISRSHIFPYYRATFWQAKKSVKPSVWNKYKYSSEQFHFLGQFNQWFLLSHRPQIVSVKPFCVPPDLLSSFTSPGIGTFGVFNVRNNIIEVNHHIAEFITCLRPPSKPCGDTFLSTNPLLKKYSYDNCEPLICDNLDIFVHDLLYHRIGAPLDLTQPSHRWLLAYSRFKLRNSNNELLADFFETADLDDIPDMSFQDNRLTQAILYIDTR